MISITILILPIMLVVTQPDLGTSVLIASSGLVVLWLSGLNIKYFVYSFISLIHFTAICNIFFKALPKTQSFNIY